MITVLGFALAGSIWGKNKPDNPNLQLDGWIKLKSGGSHIWTDGERK